MKGHIGFRCRTCARPSAPTNLRQVGSGNLGFYKTASLAWDAPAVTGDGPILGYRVERDTPTGWELLAETDPDEREVEYSWCQESGTLRVSARNRCGFGETDEFGAWLFSSGGMVQLLTASDTISPPCWATSAKFWAIGCGSQVPEGGYGGGLAYKTWEREPDEPWGDFVCVVQNANLTSSGGGPPIASVAHGGTTIYGYGATGYSVGTYSYATADGGANGCPGSGPYNSYYRYPDDDIRYYAVAGGNVAYNFGGGIGGPIGYSSGTAIYPTPISPCRRHPGTSRGGLFDAVALLGLRVLEECEEDAAFGSGGVTVTVPVYGGGSQRVDFSAGYGGGGFDATNPAGPGCIVVLYDTIGGGV